MRERIEPALFTVLLLSVGFAFSPNLDVQFTLPKLFWFRLVGAALVVAWLGRHYRGEIKPVPRSVLVGTCLLLAWWTLTTATAASPLVALQGAPGRYNGLINAATLLLAFLISASLPALRRDLHTRILLIAGTVVPLAVYTLAQYFGFDPRTWPNPRPAATIGHPVPLAAILSLAAPFVVAFTLTEADRRLRRVGFLVFALLFAAVMATLSRGPWAGFTLGVVMVVVAAYHLGSFKVSSGAIVAVAVLAALSGRTLWNSAQVVLLRDRVDTLMAIAQDPSFMNRFIYFDAGVRMVRDHPYVGIGFENFGLLYPRYRPAEGEAVPIDQIPTKVHNGYLDKAVAHGPIGLGLYLSLVGVIGLRLGQVVRRRHAAGGAESNRDVLIGVAFIGALAGFMTQDLSGWDEISLSVYFWVVLGTGVSYSMAHASEERWRPGKRWQTPIGVTGIVAATALVALSWTALREMRSGQLLFEAASLDPSKDWLRIDANLRYGLQLSGQHPDYADAAGRIYLRRFAAAGDRPTYERASQLFDAAARADPFDPYVLIHRVDLETIALKKRILSSPASDFTTVVDRLAEIDPRNPTVHVALANYRLAEGRPLDALSSILTAQSLRQRQPRYRLLEGDIHRALGDRDRQIEAYRAEAELLVDREASEEAARKLVLALIEGGQLEQAAEEAARAIQRQPRDSVMYTLQGAAYLGLRAPELASASFDEALKIDPADASARQGILEAAQQLANRRRDPRR